MEPQEITLVDNKRGQGLIVAASLVITPQLQENVIDKNEVPLLTTTIAQVENTWNISDVQKVIITALAPWETFKGELPSRKQFISVLSELSDTYFVTGNDPVLLLREYIIYYQHAYNALGNDATPEQIHAEALQALRLDMDFLTIGAVDEFRQKVEQPKQERAMQRLLDLDNLEIVGAIRGYKPAIDAVINKFKNTEFLPAVQAMVNYRHDYQMNISLAGSQRFEITSKVKELNILSPEEIQRLLAELEEKLRKLMAQLIKLGLDQSSVFNIALSRLLQNIDPSHHSQLTAALHTHFAFATQQI